MEEESSRRDFVGKLTLGVAFGGAAYSLWSETKPYLPVDLFYVEGEEFADQGARELEDALDFANGEVHEHQDIIEREEFYKKYSREGEFLQRI